MNEKPPSDKINPHRKRIIGILGDELHYELPAKVLHAVKKLAAANNAEVYYFITQPLKSNKQFHYQSNILYNFISREIIDGLIIMSNILGAYVSPEEFRLKCRQYQSLPQVSLGMDLSDMPSILADNESGIYAAVNHLIDVHHRTRIGFLKGPPAHPEAQARFRAFARAMQEHNLPVNEDLLLEGNFQSASAIRAVSKLIEKKQLLPGRDINALLCANDYMAAGAQVELLERGYRVPEDIAIIGFDDIVYAKCLNPALSSICNPIPKMAAAAFELLLAITEGIQVPETTILPTEFIPRSSCGCREGSDLPFHLLLPANSETLNQSSHNLILQSLNKRVSTTTGINIHIWQDALTFLHTYDRWKEKNQGNTMDKGFVNSAYSLLITTVDRVLDNATYEGRVQAMGVNLISTLELPELLEILCSQLPPLGIRRCYLNLYEDSADYNSPETLPPWSRMILAFRQEEGKTIREVLPPEGVRFRTRQLIPPEITAKHGLSSWIVVALYFRYEQIGFILLDSTAHKESLYYFFRFQLSSSLKGMLLLKGYQDHSRKLVQANAKIREFNKQLADENLRIKTEMDVARGIQTALLPGDVKNIHPDFEIASLMIPATEVGGDYFDIALDNRQNLWMGIGDVSGHGLKAGMIMMIAQTAQTAITTNSEATPRDVIIMMNQVLFRSVTNRMNEKQYMTCSILKYLGDGRFQHAGMHLNFLIYRQRNKTCEEIKLNGIWLNLVPDIENYTENFEFKLDIGDVLVLYTDGITEVIDKKKELLDIKGLKKIILRYGDKNINDMLNETIAEVTSWDSDEDKDDMSLVLVRRIH